MVVKQMNTHEITVYHSKVGVIQEGEQWLRDLCRFG